MNKSNTTAKEAESMKSNEFIQQEVYLQSLYAVTQHWHSDIRFFEDELDFFRSLIDKHLMLLIDSENIDETRRMVSHVIDLEKERVSLDERIALHTDHIADLVTNPYVQKVPDYKTEHAKLEVEFPVFVKKFRNVKSEVFKLTKQVIHSEKVKRIIDWG